MRAIEPQSDLTSTDYVALRWQRFKIHSQRFPYFAILLASGIYSILSIPSQLGEDVVLLLGWAIDFARRFHVQCCLVLAIDKCYYIDPNGDSHEDRIPPSGGTVIHWGKLLAGKIKSISIGEGKVFYYQDEKGKRQVVLSSELIGRQANNGLLAPWRTNPNGLDEDAFPEIIGFCERDDASHLLDGKGESYEYKFFGELVYKVVRSEIEWWIEEYLCGEAVSVSLGKDLKEALINLLCCAGDNNKQRATIVVPVKRTDVTRALALMYQLGGYPASYLPETAELGIIKDGFAGVNIEFLCYFKVPRSYFSWLADRLVQEGILGQEERYKFYYFESPDIEDDQSDPSDW